MLKQPDTDKSEEMLEEGHCMVADYQLVISRGRRGGD
jgi:hypothetical protein